MERYIKIAAGIPADKLFTYKTIQPPERKIKGCRALIPFGNRTLTGVIVDETEKPENIDIKEIIELLDEKPVFSDNMLNFTRWMADYYMASWGETLKSALPSGLSPKSVIRVERTWESSSGIIPSMKKKAPRRAAVLEAILRHEEDISIGFLENITGLQGITPQLYALEQEGLIKVHRVIVNRARSKTQKAAYIPDEILSNDEALKDIFDELDKSAPKQSLVLSNIFISQSDTSSPKLLTEIKEVTGDSGSAVKALEKKGIIKIIDLELDRNLPSDKYESLARRNEAALKLTAEQSRAADLILEKIDIGEFHPFLLHGVTGSGKTLVYMKAIKKALDSGRQALLLVPEISLTPQLIDRFELSFPGKIAVLHSRMSEGERFDSWRSIVSGKATLVIGARSAIFAPLDNPGLIIVDEEHEHSYKQEDPAPRYHARDAALVRARMDNAVAVLGSATPSIESMYNAKTGKYTLLEITSRADGASMPIIRVIDVLDSWKHGKMKGYFSEGLIEAISSRVQKNEGVIIFQNMRGYSSSLQCRNCGYVPECTNCDVTLTFHKNIAQLRCHYCGHAERAKNICPNCGHEELRQLGYGTQRIEEELAGRLKDIGIDANIERMDLDTTSRKGAHRRLLQDFAAGRTDILVGTQMVAKGLDFERVTLVGIINSDIQLFVPDFRSSERTFQLLTQVSGRAGRVSGFPGEVIIQSSKASNFAIKAAQNSNYDIFYNRELNIRKSAGYPPFIRFVMIEFYGKSREETAKHAVYFLKYMPRNQNVFTLLGPTEPTIPRIRNLYRKIIIIKVNKELDPGGYILRKILSRSVQQYRETHGSTSVRLVVDIDSYRTV